ncbi:transcription initiation factor TFIID subunit 4-like [Oryctolagus cuniculus]|uniref:transcription initiation factor TFIID subunit 4-like n=1 Tax=Oryctolagus cuniculus TaxID=9986 RepID=UPI003879806B
MDSDKVSPLSSFAEAQAGGVGRPQALLDLAVQSAGHGDFAWRSSLGSAAGREEENPGHDLRLVLGGALEASVGRALPHMVIPVRLLPAGPAVSVPHVRPAWSADPSLIRSLKLNAHRQGSRPTPATPAAACLGCLAEYIRRGKGEALLIRGGPTPARSPGLPSPPPPACARLARHRHRSPAASCGSRAPAPGASLLFHADLYLVPTGRGAGARGVPGAASRNSASAPPGARSLSLARSLLPPSPSLPLPPARSALLLEGWGKGRGAERGGWCLLSPAPPCSCIGSSGLPPRHPTPLHLRLALGGGGWRCRCCSISREPRPCARHRHCCHQPSPRGAVSPLRPPAPPAPDGPCTLALRCGGGVPASQAVPVLCASGRFESSSPQTWDASRRLFCHSLCCLWSPVRWTDRRRCPAWSRGCSCSSGRLVRSPCSLRPSRVPHSPSPTLPY